MAIMHSGRLLVRHSATPMAPQAGPMISMTLRPLTSEPNFLTIRSEILPVMGIMNTPKAPMSM